MMIYNRLSAINRVAAGFLIITCCIGVGSYGRMKMVDKLPETNLLVKHAPRIPSPTPKVETEAERISRLERDNHELRTRIVSRGTKKIYSMQAWVWDLCSEYGSKEGVPKEVWYPIVMLESGGKPTSKMVTKDEDSRGLLQINTKVHPVDKTKVYDPVYNLEYQMPKLGKAYREAKAKGLKGLDVVYYVERYGQKCFWTDEVAKTLKRYYKEVTGQ